MFRGRIVWTWLGFLKGHLKARFLTRDKWDKLMMFLVVVPESYHRSPFSVVAFSVLRAPRNTQALRHLSKPESKRVLALAAVWNEKSSPLISARWMPIWQNSRKRRRHPHATSSINQMPRHRENDCSQRKMTTNNICCPRTSILFRTWWREWKKTFRTSSGV